MQGKFPCAGLTFSFCFSLCKVVALQSYLDSYKGRTQSSHCYQKHSKQTVLKANDQVKKLLHEVQSLFPGRNYQETTERHKAEHTLCLTPGKLSRNVKYEVSQTSNRYSHWSPSSFAVHVHQNFSPGFAF